MEHQYVEEPPMEDAYDDRSLISEGKFGATVRMRCKNDLQVYAVKRIRCTSLTSHHTTSDILAQECKLLESLLHPHIVRYIATFLSKNGRFFNIVMQLVEGETISGKIVCAIAPTEGEIVAWAFQLASALSYMHGRGVFHRDLKADNIRLTESGHIIVTGTDLSCLTAASGGALTVYSSYERAAGLFYDGRDDVWAVGCILLELLTRARLLYSLVHSDRAEVAERRSLLLSAAAAVSPRLGGEILPRLLSPLQEHRYTAQALLDVLGPSLRTQSRDVAPVAPEEPDDTAIFTPAIAEPQVPQREDQEEWYNDPELLLPPETKLGFNDVEKGEEAWANDPELLPPQEAGVKLASACDQEEEEWINDPVLPSHLELNAGLDAAELEEEGGWIDDPVLYEGSVGDIDVLVQHLRHESAHSQESAANSLIWLVRSPADRAQLATAGDIPLWIHLLTKGTTESAQLVATLAMRFMARDAGIARSLVAAGALPPLLQLLREETRNMKEAAVKTLRDLAVDVDNKEAIVRGGAVHVLVQLLKESAQCVDVAHTLRLLAVDTEGMIVIAAAGAVPLFVNMLIEGTECAKEAAASALWNLAVEESNKKCIALAGAIPPLVKLLKEGSENAKRKAAAALGNLAVDAENEKSIAAAGAIPALVRLLSEGTESGKEMAAAALRNLAVSSENKKIVEASGAIPILLILLNGGTKFAKTAALAVLRNLAADVEIRKIFKAVVAGGAHPMLAQLIREEEAKNVQNDETAAVQVPLVGVEGNKNAVSASIGPIPALVQLLLEGSESAKEMAAAALGNFSLKPENTKAIAAAGAIPPLVQLLRNGTKTAKEAAVATLRNLAADAGNRKLMFAAGVIPLLVPLLLDDTLAMVNDAIVVALGNLALDSENRNDVAVAIPQLVQLLRESPWKAEKVAKVLLNLSLDAVHGQIVGAAVGAIPALVKLMTVGTPIAQETAMSTLFYLAVNANNRKNITAAGAIPILVEQLGEGSLGLTTEAAKALRNLAVDPDNKKTIATAGAIPKLVLLVMEGTDHSKKVALELLVSLAAAVANKKTMVEAGAIRALAYLVREGSESVKDAAVTALWSVVSDSKEAKAALKVENPVEALQWVQQHGTVTGKDSATKLLQQLWSWWF